MIFFYLAVCYQHAVGINNSDACASKEAGPFIATNSFIFVYDGEQKMLYRTEAAQNTDGNRRQQCVRYGICIMRKLRNASERMINKRPKHGGGGASSCV